MAGKSERRNSNTQLLQELETLSQSLYESHTARRTASLVLPRSSTPPVSSSNSQSTATRNEEKPESKAGSRRISMSPWRSRPKQESEESKQQDSRRKVEEQTDSSEKKGIWNWKPVRALSRITMNKMSCLFSVEVIGIHGLTASMNGLRVSVSVRKKETKDGVVQTMPARVLQGNADFEETLFIKCHVYCTGNVKQMKFEPRPFVISVVAVDAIELDFGRGLVDLSQLIHESMQKNYEGTRIRQWDMKFDLYGKAKGGELVLKLGFQIMDKDIGQAIYSQSESFRSDKGRDSSPFARKHSKNSFSVTSPRITSKSEPLIPMTAASSNVEAMDEFNLDEPVTVIPPPKFEQGPQTQDQDLPDFEVVDKGVEIQELAESSVVVEVETKETVDDKSVSSEVVKEVVIQDPLHQMRMSELDSIAQQIEALESMIESKSPIEIEQGNESHRLDEDEETVTREFIQLLEEEEEQEKIGKLNVSDFSELEDSKDLIYLPDLGKGLGHVIQTRDGGYLTATNPLDVEMTRKETPKLAMQISKPLILPYWSGYSGFEIFQGIANVGIEELMSEILMTMAMDDLEGKTAEQIAFEGIASAIIHGRNKEGANSSAARSIAVVKSMSTAMVDGRKERISTGIWNVNENPVTITEVLAFSLQKIETMTVEALKIQADVTEEEAPFEVSPLGAKNQHRILDSACPPELYKKPTTLSTTKDLKDSLNTITMMVLVQPRDPLRQYEAVGSRMIVLSQFIPIVNTKDSTEEKFKVVSLHIGGLKMKSGAKKNVWDSEKQRSTAMDWLVSYGLGKKTKLANVKESNILWSISSRVMADMWLKSIRNPDVKFLKQ